VRAWALAVGLAVLAPPIASAEGAPRPEDMTPEELEAYTWSILAPPRRRGVRLEVGAGPLVGRSLPGGVVLAAVHVRARRRFFARVQLAPSGAVRLDGRRLGLLDATAVLGYGGKRGALGVGPGVGLVRVSRTRRRAEGVTPMGILQFRLGTEDGLHMRVSFTTAFIGRNAVLVGGFLGIRFAFPADYAVVWETRIAPGLSAIDTLLGLEVPRAGRAICVTPFLGALIGTDDVRLDSAIGGLVGVRLVVRRERGASD